MFEFLLISIFDVSIHELQTRIKTVKIQGVWKNITANQAFLPKQNYTPSKLADEYAWKIEPINCGMHRS